jgi:hypothetical protein
VKTVKAYAANASDEEWLHDLIHAENHVVTIVAPDCLLIRKRVALRRFVIEEYKDWFSHVGHRPTRRE